MIDILNKYFTLSDIQKERLELLYHLYMEWNSKINVISRKDTDNFYCHHVLHSLSIAKLISFQDNTHIMDLGTGGGFPGIPLAIMFPDAQFLLVDSIAKKLKVVEDVANKLNLNNVKTFWGRGEDINLKFDFIVSRAVTQFPVFYGWVKDKISTHHHNTIPNGIIYLKGGDLEDELKPFKDSIKIFNISDYFDEDFFETKKIVYKEMLG